MALVLRLTALSYVVAHAEARWFQMGADAGNWVPAIPTTEPTASSAEQWESKTTSAPRRRPVDWELRRRDESTSTICGYSLNNLAGPPVTCGKGEYCRLSSDFGLVGCCTATNSRDCVLPTACLDSSRSAELSNGDTPLTTYCSNSNRPYCVTHSYDANFFDPLNGASFVGCAARPASGVIVASSVMGGDTSSTMSLSTFTTTNGATTATVTVLLPSNSATTTAGPDNFGSSSNSRNVGAIAGGVVGGVAGLALLIGAIAFCIYRRKKRPPNPDTLGYGPKMPPSDQDMYHNEQIPGSQYPSSFFGEAPPGMMQGSEQPAMAYPPNAYGIQHSNSIYTAGHNHSVEVPVYQPQYQPQHQPQRAVPSKHHDGGVSPLEESPVSPVSPAENYNTMVSALSNQSPPLQPLQPAVHRPQSEYAPYSPPPPEQYQSYHPYPGT